MGHILEGLTHKVENVPKLIIIDPSMKDYRGHHFELSKLIATEAVRHGFVVHILANTEYIGESFGPDTTIHKLFDFTIYDRYVGGRENGPGDTDASDEAFADTLQEALTTCKASEADIILSHTTDASMFRSMLAYFRQFGAKALPIHLATPFDEHVMPGKSKHVTLGETLARLRQVASGKVFLWAENTPLATHLSALWNMRVEPLILPAKPGSRAVPKYKGAGAPFLLSYLGAAREEKGFTLLPDLVEGVLAHPDCEHVRCFIQCSPQIIGYLPPIKAALARLEPLEGDRVSLCRKAMPSDEYAQVLDDSDGLLLLYDYEKYRVRGSAIAWDGVISGKILVTRTGTFPASILTHGGGLVADNIDDWIEGIASLGRNWENQKAALEAQAEFFSQWASSERYLNRLSTRPKREAASQMSPCSTIKIATPKLLRRVPEIV